MDVTNRQAHFFGITFAPQDFWLGFFVLTGVGFSLFFLTALVGRVWCGWACPQTVFLDQVFRRIERLIEGDSVARQRLDAAPWDFSKASKRLLKHACFVIFSLGITHLFISYFISLPRLYDMMHQSPAENWGIFLFVFVLGGILYFNFAWFREQFCIVLCPYGRLQSALLDKDSMVIGYDERRGEPRGKLSEKKGGDCVDCLKCIQVCPTGIDIRQGIQMECIACANCIDACDSVMDKIGKERGLIRYDSTAGLMGEKTKWIRPRTVIYGVLLVVGAIVLGISLAGIRSVNMGVVRMTGAPYYLADGGIRNQYLVHLTNKQNHPVTVSVRQFSKEGDLKMKGFEQSVTLPPQRESQHPLILILPEREFDGPFQVKVRALDEDGRVIDAKTTTFLGPEVRE